MWQLAFQKCAICAILLHGENIWNPGIFVKITFTRKKQTMRNHDWPKFPRDMWCSVAFLWGYHSFPLLLCEVLGGVIQGCKMFPRICYPMFWGYQFISPGFWGGFGDIKCEKPVRGKIRKMSFRQNDCTGKKTFWKASGRQSQTRNVMQWRCKQTHSSTIALFCYSYFRGLSFSF